MTNYLVACTFDLQGADEEGYRRAYTMFEGMGLRRVLVGNGDVPVVAPTTTVFGEFQANSSQQLVTDLRRRSLSNLPLLGLRGEVFMVAGTDWAWVSGRT